MNNKNNQNTTKKSKKDSQEKPAKKNADIKESRYQQTYKKRD